MSVILDYLKKFPVMKTVYTVVLLLVCLFATKIILSLVDRFLKRSKIEPLVRNILRVAIKVFLLFTTFIVVLQSIGISVTSLIAALSVIGVAFSLAIQGFLSNVFGGIQIISNRPFKVGDYVEAGGESGSVREVGLFYTKLDTPDKKLVQIPNSKIANDSIINYSSAKNRRVEFFVSVSYDDDSEKVKNTLLSLLTEHPLVLKNKDVAPLSHIYEYRDNDICYIARAWCKNSDYWTVYFDIMDAIKPTFEKNGITFSYPHVNVHMVKE